MKDFQERVKKQLRDLGVDPDEGKRELPINYSPHFDDAIGYRMRVLKHFPEGTAIEVWQDKGVVFSISKFAQGKHPMFPEGFWTAIARFPVSPIDEEGGRKGMIKHLATKKAVTFSQSIGKAGHIYGIDFAEPEYVGGKIPDIKMIKEEIYNVAVAIMEASRFEESYLEADEDGKKKIAAEYAQLMKEKYGLVQSFESAMINRK